MSPPADSPSAARVDEAARLDLDERLNEYAKWALPVLSVTGAIAGGFMVGPAGVILALAAGALIGVILIFWASIRTLVGERGLSAADAYALAAPRAEEEQKRAVLRALKDLEFERSVGKLSEADYRALVSKYRTEAKRLLQLLEEEAEPRRGRVEALVAKRLKRAGLALPAASSESTDPPASSATATSSSRAAASPDDVVPPLRRKNETTPSVDAGFACDKCGTMNDDDAMFCKRCGERREKGVPSEAQE